MGNSEHSTTYKYTTTRCGFVYDTPYQSTLVYVFVVPCSEFPIVPSYSHTCSAMVGVPFCRSPTAPPTGKRASATSKGTFQPNRTRS